jgi:hypothetical protein
MADIGDAQLQQLLRRLIHGTLTGKIGWSDTDRPAAYQCSLSNSSVVIATSDDDGRAPWEFEILNSNGELVERLWAGGTNQKWGADLSELYTAARRSARKLHVVLNDILAELPDLPSDEPPF